MIRPLVSFVLLSFAAPAAAAQSGAAATPADDLPTVTISRPVMANGKPLPLGTYQIRITMDRPTLPSGAPSETQRWVELIADGKVVAREVAEIVPVESPSPVGTSSASRSPVVQLLKEGDFVRISMREDGLRYLIYLPTSGVP